MSSRDESVTLFAGSDRLGPQTARMSATFFMTVVGSIRALVVLDLEHPRRSVSDIAARMESVIRSA